MVTENGKLPEVIKPAVKMPASYVVIGKPDTTCAACGKGRAATGPKSRLVVYLATDNVPISATYLCAYCS